ncbi:MAG: adenylosuccinate synthase [Candidatus Diapherotrites archaeon]|uniref:Adenylosuccinate synthetase n=1 Tax=Candidatus Iainarchaeum sp. TaxID=3101447 RepID=A0A2D6LP35_9ARCH|nr:adenylosuccinate synthase [Candidatus Diapherotrites archaeon]|tara:strand:- start:9772 stop:11028 length:1257 start_codon:yes stop_codon:yes gene_type:complete
MTGTVVIGSQFGDEGKGKVTDFYGKNTDLVVRYQGGNNAGHTVVIGDQVLKFHLLPSGVAQGKRILIGAGVVLDPRVLKKEVEEFKEKVDLGIDPRTHIIMPWHNLEDEGREDSRGKTKIGTTKRGIGPAYADKAQRVGIRFEDLVDKNRLAEKIRDIFPVKKAILEKVYDLKLPFNENSVLEEYSKLGELFRPMLSDVSLEVCTALDDEKRVLFEGAQGTFLDNDFGTYPFVTSSHPISGGVSTGVGMPLNKINRIIGIVKAYTTRVGFGPFPTELNDEIGTHLVETGKEFGTTTGRKRRVGWLDLPMMKTSMRLNGFSEIAITKLDVLSGLEKVKVCTSYNVGDKKIDLFPYSNKGLENAVANYKEFDGFTITGKEKNYSDLDENAKKYLDFIEKEIGAPIKLVSIGPGREETVLK